MASSYRLDTAIKEMMSETVTVVPELAYNDYGEATHDSGLERIVDCLIQGSNRVFRRTDETEVRISFDIYADDINIDQEDKIVMSDDTVRTIQTIETYYDETGALFQVVGVL